MNEFWEKVEHVNGKLIPYCIVLLLIIIIVEVFLHIENHLVHLILKIVDYIIITIFIVDLVCLAIKAKHQGHGVGYFLKKYWLDILAVFPFVLFLEGISRSFRLFTATESVVLGQGIVHESLELTKATSRAEKLVKVGRGLRIGARVVRVITKSNSIIRFKRKQIKFPF